MPRNSVKRDEEFLGLLETLLVKNSWLSCVQINVEPEYGGLCFRTVYSQDGVRNDVLGSFSLGVSVSFTREAACRNQLSGRLSQPRHPGELRRAKPSASVPLSRRAREEVRRRRFTYEAHFLGVREQGFGLSCGAGWGGKVFELAMRVEILRWKISFFIS